jgi:hypothetical protein
MSFPAAGNGNRDDDMNEKNIIIGSIIAIIGAVCLGAPCVDAGEVNKPNVLFIAVDEADIHLWNMVIYSDELFYYNHR